MNNEQHFESQELIKTSYIDLTRHGNRFGGVVDVVLPNGTVVHFDDTQELTPEGILKSSEFGSTYGEDVDLVHPRGGDEKRHGQTGEHVLEGSQKFGETGRSPVFSSQRKVKGARRAEGTDYASSGMPKDFLNSIKKIIAVELNKIVVGLKSDELEKVIDENAGAEFRAKLRERAQVIGLKEAMKNDAMTQLAAENEAYELMHVLELTRRDRNLDRVAAVPVVGSGMFAESIYKYALEIEDEKTGQKKTGFENIDEIGGFTSQGTALRIKVEQDLAQGDKMNLEDYKKDTRFSYEFTDPARVELFKDKKISLNWNKVEELARAAAKRFNSAS